jgi:hypothetical protein
MPQRNYRRAQSGQPHPVSGPGSSGVRPRPWPLETREGAVIRPVRGLTPAVAQCNDLPTGV